MRGGRRGSERREKEWGGEANNGIHSYQLKKLREHVRSEYKKSEKGRKREENRE